MYAPECKSLGSVTQAQCNVQGVQWVRCLWEKCRDDLSSYQLLSQSVKCCGFYFIVEQFYLSYFQPILPTFKIIFHKYHGCFWLRRGFRLRLWSIKCEVTYFESNNVNIRCRNLRFIMVNIILPLPVSETANAYRETKDDTHTFCTKPCTCFRGGVKSSWTSCTLFLNLFCTRRSKTQRHLHFLTPWHRKMCYCCNSAPVQWTSCQKNKPRDTCPPSFCWKFNSEQLSVVWIIFWYNRYFWQRSSIKWIYFPIPVRYKIYQKWPTLEPLVPLLGEIEICVQ